MFADVIEVLPQGECRDPGVAAAVPRQRADDVAAEEGQRRDVVHVLHLLGSHHRGAAPIEQ